MYSIIILEKIPGKLISFKIEILIEKILETKVEPGFEKIGIQPKMLKKILPTF